MLSKPANPGSHRGEGFVTYKVGSTFVEPVRMDVDQLNDQLRHTGAARLRNVVNPDAAFGLIFNFDTVIADTKYALALAWQELARAKGLPVPEASRVMVHNACPERIMMDVSAPCMLHALSYAVTVMFTCRCYLSVCLLTACICMGAVSFPCMQLWT